MSGGRSRQKRKKGDPPGDGSAKKDDSSKKQAPKKPSATKVADKSEKPSAAKVADKSSAVVEPSTSAQVPIVAITGAIPSEVASVTKGNESAAVNVAGTKGVKTSKPAAAAAAGSAKSTPTDVDNANLTETTKAQDEAADKIVRGNKNPAQLSQKEEDDLLAFTPGDRPADTEEENMDWSQHDFDLSNVTAETPIMAELGAFVSLHPYDLVVNSNAREAHERDAALVIATNAAILERRAAKRTAAVPTAEDPAAQALPVDRSGSEVDSDPESNASTNSIPLVNNGVKETDDDKIVPRTDNLEKPKPKVDRQYPRRAKGYFQQITKMPNWYKLGVLKSSQMVPKRPQRNNRVDESWIADDSDTEEEKQVADVLKCKDYRYRFLYLMTLVKGSDHPGEDHFSYEDKVITASLMNIEALWRPGNRCPFQMCRYHDFHRDIGMRTLMTQQELFRHLCEVHTPCLMFYVCPIKSGCEAKVDRVGELYAHIRKGIHQKGLQIAKERSAAVQPHTEVNPLYHSGSRLSHDDLNVILRIMGRAPAGTMKQVPKVKTWDDVDLESSQFKVPARPKTTAAQQRRENKRKREESSSRGGRSSSYNRGRNNSGNSTGSNASEQGKGKAGKFGLSKNKTFSEVAAVPKPTPLVTKMVADAVLASCDGLAKDQINKATAVANSFVQVMQERMVGVVKDFHAAFNDHMEPLRTTVEQLPQLARLREVEAELAKKETVIVSLQRQLAESQKVGSELRTVIDTLRTQVRGTPRSPTCKDIRIAEGLVPPPKKPAPPTRASSLGCQDSSSSSVANTSGISSMGTSTPEKLVSVDQLNQSVDDVNKGARTTYTPQQWEQMEQMQAQIDGLKAQFTGVNPVRPRYPHPYGSGYNQSTPYQQNYGAPPPGFASPRPSPGYDQMQSPAPRLEYNYEYPQGNQGYPPYAQQQHYPPQQQYPQQRPYQPLFPGFGTQSSEQNQNQGQQLQYPSYPEYDQSADQSADQGSQVRVQFGPVTQAPVQQEQRGFPMFPSQPAPRGPVPQIPPMPNVPVQHVQQTQSLLTESAQGGAMPLGDMARFVAEGTLSQLGLDPTPPRGRSRNRGRGNLSRSPGSKGSRGTVSPSNSKSPSRNTRSMASPKGGSAETTPTKSTVTKSILKSPSKSTSKEPEEVVSKETSPVVLPQNVGETETAVIVIADEPADGSTDANAVSRRNTKGPESRDDYPEKKDGEESMDLS